MSEPLGLLADITAAVIIMFIFPVLMFMGFGEKVHDLYLSDIVSEFKEDICESGFIDEASYGAFVRKSCPDGRKRQITITNTSVRYEPVYENGVFTGRIAEYEQVESGEDIMAALDRNGYFDCRYGSMIHITVFDNDIGLVTAEGTVRGKQKR